MKQGGHVLQQRGRRAQLGGETSEVVGRRMVGCCRIVSLPTLNYVGGSADGRRNQLYHYLPYDWSDGSPQAR